MRLNEAPKIQSDPKSLQFAHKNAYTCEQRMRLFAYTYYTCFYAGVLFFETIMWFEEKYIIIENAKLGRFW